MKIKICCISSPDEAKTAIALGADALGLVGAMPSGPGVIADELAQSVVRVTPPPIATFMLTSETTADGIIAHHRRVGANTIQLVDAVPPGTYAQLREALPAVKLVQVIHVLDDISVDEALQAVSEGADALLLDSGNPNLVVKELGEQAGYTIGRLADGSCRNRPCLYSWLVVCGFKMCAKPLRQCSRLDSTFAVVYEPMVNWTLRI